MISRIGILTTTWSTAVCQQILMTPDRVFSPNKYVEYIPGDLNVILSVPHGGHTKPKSIPDRDAGAFVKGRVIYDHKYDKQKDVDNFPVKYKCDLNTVELTLLVADELSNLTGGRRPHVILNRLYRGKLDCNCDMEKATFNVPEALIAWEAFHGFISTAKSAIHGRGLFLDMHGHVHPENWVELGYTLTAQELNEGTFSASCTSISNLFQSLPQMQSQELISGPMSFGGLLSLQGYTTVPSPTHPKPGGGKYYTGGYNTETHGSRNGGIIDSIQIESPKWARTKTHMADYSKALAQAIHKFLQLYYSD